LRISSDAAAIVVRQPGKPKRESSDFDRSAATKTDER